MRLLGIYLKEKGLMLLAKNNMMIYSMSMDLFKAIEKYSKLLFVFSKEQTDFWENWIAENKNVNKIDYSFEKKFIKIQNKKSKGLFRRYFK